MLQTLKKQKKQEDVLPCHCSISATIVTIVQLLFKHRFNFIFNPVDNDLK